MKIIGLIPVRNEEWILPTCVTSLRKFCDDIIAFDDNSTDSSVEILKSLGVSVYHNKNLGMWGDVERSNRENLLKLGRERGGTHFVCVDADECFTSNFEANAKELISKLRPGQKLSLQWMALWRDMRAFRNDSSIWSNNFKDFIVYDTGSLSYDDGFLCVGHTPGSNNSTWIKITREQGSVLHFQFSHWNRFQIKQAWYQCTERIKLKNVEDIRSKYCIVLDDDYKNTPLESWEIENVLMPYRSDDIVDDWHLADIYNWFDQYGIEFFKPLNIWHIGELKREYEKRMKL